MHGFEIAKVHGLNVRFICTFTNKSIHHKEEIFDFFKKNGFVLKLHPALPSLRSENPKEWALEPVDYGALLVYLLDKSLENIGIIEVMNINDLCRCVFTAGQCVHVGQLHGKHVCCRPGWQHLSLLPVRGDAGVGDGKREGPADKGRPHAVRTWTTHDSVF